MDNIKKFEDFLDRMQGLLDNAKKQGHILVRVEDLESTFPELKKLDDEKICEQIISFIEEYGNPVHCEWQKDWIAWLEKQGEQKSIKWSEEDEDKYRQLIDTINLSYMGSVSLSEKYRDEYINWINSLKERMK